MPESRRPIVRWVVLGLLFSVVVAYQGRITVDVVRGLVGPAADDVRWPIVLESYGPAIKSVEPEAAAAGIREGDRLITAAGRAFLGRSDLARPLAAARPGDVLRLGIARHEQVLRVEVTLAAVPPTRPGLGERIYRVVIGLAMPLVCLVVGFSVAALKPRDLRAWLLLGMLVSFLHLAPGFEPGRLWTWGDAVRVPAIVVSGALHTGWFAFMFLFGLHFPERFAFEKQRWWLRWLLLGPLLVFGVADSLAMIGRSEDFSFGAVAHGFLGRFGGAVLAFRMAAIGCFFASLGAKHGMTKAPDDRRRLLLLNVGTHVALNPTLFLLLVSLFRTGRIDFSYFPAWLSGPALSAVFLFPLTLAYVVVVHRALDVRLVIRQGLQYALARGGLRFVQVALSAVVILVGASLAVDPGANRPARITAIALVVMTVFLLQLFSARLAAWIDRRFFREAYDAEKILSELAEEVRTMIETGPLLRRLTERISASLHVPRAAVLLRTEGAYRPAFALGYGPDPDVSFPEGAGTVRRLREDGKPVRMYLEDPESWVHRQPDVGATERASLSTLQTQLLLPLGAKDELLGFMSLGQKQSDAAYSRTDLRLLQSVATQAGLALEIGRLTEAIAREVAHRERHRRELEIAREVQEQLFPQNRPAVPGLDYAGACRPALGVGGDYFDFLALDGGRFGLAIGDVAGKGISAALLMASLQASLRGQTLSGGADLASLMGNVNRLICDASLANRYATFFYSQYDPVTLELSYVNAGHNAPMLFRDGGVIRLDQGGTVVGLLPAFRYQQASVTLRPGDVLVGFTDGISEAMNTADEEWGEERLMEAVNRCREASAEALLRHLIDSADAFAAGAKQHDDMTLVVARVL